MSLPRLKRRQFLQTSTALTLGALAPRLTGAPTEPSVPVGPFQCMGLRIGEVSEGTAYVWTRLTAAAPSAPAASTPSGERRSEEDE
jgi:phosphodiesterase/alkaline phosphatase D-like protein